MLCYVNNKSKYLIGGPENVTPTNECVTSQLKKGQSYPQWLCRGKQGGRWVVVLLFIKEAEGKI